MKKTETKKYYFSVEGETEKWYLNWLKENINNENDLKHKVIFDISVERDPLSRVKMLTPQQGLKIEIAHIFDMEGEDDECITAFRNTLKRMKRAEKLGKKIKYKLGYNNFSFELWILLHKTDCNGYLNNKNQYLNYINKTYSRKFLSLDAYKEENNFKRILADLTLDDVFSAISKAKNIMLDKKSCDSSEKYCGYEYYKKNPSLSIGEIIEGILIDCGLFTINNARE